MFNWVFTFHSFHVFNKKIDPSIITEGEDLKWPPLNDFLSEFLERLFASVLNGEVNCYNYVLQN